MKILTKEEEDAHYRHVLTGGIGGGVVGLAASSLGVWGLTRRYPAFARLTFQFRVYLAASAASFSAIICADRWSRSYEASQRPDLDYTQQKQSVLHEVEAKREASMSKTQRWMEWAHQNKYSIVAGSWVVSIAVAFAIVNRNRFLSAQQKLVQARVYAQGLTVAVMVASLALETHDRTQTAAPLSEEDIHKDQWKDMVAAAERRMKDRGESLKG